MSTKQVKKKIFYILKNKINQKNPNKTKKKKKKKKERKKKSSSYPSWIGVV